MKKLIIAEKSSFAKKISNSLKVKDQNGRKGYYEDEQFIITWLAGHLYILKEPHEHQGYEYLKEWALESLPFFIPKLEYKLDDSKNKARQHEVIVKLFRRQDIDIIVNACDAGIEGSLIFYITYTENKCTKPVKRLWVTATTQNAIIKAFRNLRSQEYDINLYKAGMIRQAIDMHIGLNMTRLYSLIVNTTARLGRVKMPVISEIVKREEEINNFVPTPYWELYVYTNKDFKCKWYKEQDNKSMDRFTDKNKVKEYKNYIANNRVGRIIDIKKENRKKYADKLYSIEELYKDANKHYGYKPFKTLEIAQALYDNEYISYPRTPSSYLNKSSFEMTKVILNKLKQESMYSSYLSNMNLDNIKITERIFNDTLVEDHEAIIPTENIPLKLAKDEQNIYSLIVKRFIASFLEPLEYEKMVVVCGFGEQQEQTFKATGKIIINEGYKAVYKNEADAENTQEENEVEDVLFSKMSIGDMVVANDVKILNKKTMALPRYTMRSIIDYMTNAVKKAVLNDEKQLKRRISEKKIGLGTPATMASILREIEDNRYIKFHKKNIYPTEFAVDIVKILPKEYKSPTFTMEVHRQLMKIIKGECKNPIEFLKQTYMELEDIVKEINETDIDIDYSSNNSLTTCPICNGDILIKKDGYCCSNYKEKCNVYLSKKNNPFFDKFKIKLSQSNIKDLIDGGYVYLEGLKNDEDKVFSTVIVLERDVDNKRLNYKFDYDRVKEAREGLREKKIVGKCLDCGGIVRETSNGFKCDNYKKKDTNCLFYLSKKDKNLAKYNKKFTKTIVKSLLKKNKAKIKNMKNSRDSEITLYKNEKGYYGWKFL